MVGVAPPPITPPDVIENKNKTLLDQGTLTPAFFEVIRIYILQAERWFLPNSRAVEAIRKTSRSGCTLEAFRSHFCMENLDQKFQGMWQQ